jgi:hypothetical protein
MVGPHRVAAAARETLCVCALAAAWYTCLPGTAV